MKTNINIKNNKSRDIKTKKVLNLFSLSLLMLFVIIIFFAEALTFVDDTSTNFTAGTFWQTNETDGNVTLALFDEDITDKNFNSSISASSEYSVPDNTIYKAIDNTIGGLVWATASGQTNNQWILFNFSSSKKVYQINILNGQAALPNRAIKNMVIQGNNNGSFGKSDHTGWTNISTTLMLNHSAATYWENLTSDNFTNNNYYNYYRIWIENNWGDTYLSIDELEIWAGYKPQGNFTSQTFDGGSVVSWDNISWSENDADYGGLDDDTKLLLHFDGANASTTFTDSSGSAHSTIVGKGNPFLETSVKKFEESSLRLDGSSYANVSDSADFDFEDGEFTIDFWVYWNAFATGDILGQKFANGNLAWYFTYDDTRKISFYAYDSGVSCGVWMYPDTWTPSAKTWYHIAVQRINGNMSMFINGINYTDQLTYYPSWAWDDIGDCHMPDVTAELNIGGVGGDGSKFPGGFIDEVRISKGIARYTGNFTVPDEPYSHGKINMFYRTSNDTTTWTNWNLTSSGENFNDEGQYLQYKANLSTDDSDYTPYLEWVNVSYHTLAVAPTVTLTAPEDNDRTNSATNSTLNFNASFTGTPSPTTCSLWINSTGTHEVNQTVTGLTLTTTGFSIPTPTEETVTHILWNINCSNPSGNSFATANRTIHIDNVNPIITITTPNENNQSIYGGTTTTFNLDVSASDSFGLWEGEVNITDSTGVNKFSKGNQSHNNITQVIKSTITISSWATGNYTLAVRWSDPHTYGSLHGLTYDIQNDGIEFSKGSITKKIYFGYWNNGIQFLTPAQITAYNVSAKVENINNEYKITIYYSKPMSDFNFGFAITEDMMELVNANKGHFVWKDWYIDFEDMLGDYDISYKNNNGYNVIYTSTSYCSSAIGEQCEIDPVVGGLNIVEQNITFEIDNNITLGIVNFTPSSSPHYNQSNTQFKVFAVEDNPDKLCLLINSTSKEHTCVAYTSNTATSITETLSDGNYLISFSINDTMGNLNFSNNITYIKDTTSPTITITTQNHRYINSNNISFIGTASDANENTITINDTDFGTNLGSFSNWKFDNTSAMTNKKYYVNVSAQDLALNHGDTYYNFTFDNVNITVTTDEPIDDTTSYTSTITFKYTPTDTNIANCTLYHNQSGSLTANWTNVSLSTGVQAEGTLTLTDGNYLWNVMCEDKAHNSKWGTELELTIDTSFGFSARSKSPVTVYSNQSVTFNTTITGQSQLDHMLFENNFTGTLVNWTNTTLLFQNNSAEYFTIIHFHNFTSHSNNRWGFCMNSTTASTTCDTLQTFTLQNYAPDKATLTTSNATQFSNRTPTLVYTLGTDLDNDALKHYLIIDDNEDWSSVTINDSISANYNVTSDLTDLTTYYWKIESNDDYESNVSGAGSFVINTTILRFDGYVKDAYDELPINNARIDVYDDSNNLNGTVNTNSDGYYLYKTNVSANYWFKLRKSDYLILEDKNSSLYYKLVDAGEQIDFNMTSWNYEINETAGTTSGVTSSQLNETFWDYFHCDEADYTNVWICDVLRNINETVVDVNDTLTLLNITINEIYTNTDTLETVQSYIQTNISALNTIIGSNFTNTTQDIGWLRNYVSVTLFGEVDNVEEDLTKAILNQTTIYDKIISVYEFLECNATSENESSSTWANYSLCWNLNQTRNLVLNMGINLTDVKDRLILMNTTLILTNTTITSVYDDVQELNTILGSNFTNVTADLGYIRDYLSSTIYSYLTGTIYPSIDTLESGQTTIQTDISTLNTIIGSNFTNTTQDIGYLRNQLNLLDTEITQAQLNQTTIYNKILSVYNFVECNNTDYSSSTWEINGLCFRLNNTSDLVLDIGINLTDAKNRLINMNTTLIDVNDTTIEIKEQTEEINKTTKEINETITDAYNLLKELNLTLTNMSKDVDVYLSDFGEIAQEKEYKARLIIKDKYGYLLEPDTAPIITLFDSLNQQIASVSMTKIYNGYYSYSYNTSSSSNTGVWLAVVNTTVNGQGILSTDWFEVESSVAEVTIQVVDTTIPDIICRIQITNEGTASAEFEYRWWITDYSRGQYGDSTMIDSGSASKQIGRGEIFSTDKTLSLNEIGNYWCKVEAGAIGSSELSGASDQFTSTLAGFGGIKEIPEKYFLKKVITTNYEFYFNVLKDKYKANSTIVTETTIKYLGKGYEEGTLNIFLTAPDCDITRDVFTYCSRLSPIYHHLNFTAKDNIRVFYDRIELPTKTQLGLWRGNMLYRTNTHEFKLFDSFQAVEKIGIEIWQVLLLFLVIYFYRKIPKEK